MPGVILGAESPLHWGDQIRRNRRGEITPPRETHGPGPAVTNAEAEYLPSHKVSKAKMMLLYYDRSFLVSILIQWHLLLSGWRKTLMIDQVYFILLSHCHALSLCDVS